MAEARVIGTIVVIVVIVIILILVVVVLVVEVPCCRELPLIDMTIRGFKIARCLKQLRRGVPEAVP